MYLLDTNVISELHKVSTGKADGLGRQRRVLRTWFKHQVMPAFDGRVLQVDTAIALRSAQLHVPDPHPVRDGLIAATALAHDMTVVTRSTADFPPTGVAVLNPWGVGS